MINKEEVILTYTYIKKIVNILYAIAEEMNEDELLSISMINNSIVIDSDTITMVIKLENQ